MATLTGSSVKDLGLVPHGAPDIRHKVKAAGAGHELPGPVWEFETDEGATVQWFEAPSLNRFVDVLERTGTDSDWTNREDDDDDEWSGGTWSEGLRLSREGWDAALPDLDSHGLWERDADLTGFAPKVGPIGGGAVDFESFRLGLPDCVRTWEAGEVRRRVLSVAVNVTAHCGVQSSELAQWAGSIGAAVMDAVRQGVTVEVFAYASFRATGSSDRFVVSVPVADNRAPVPDAVMLYGLGHPAFLRRLTFAAVDWFSTKGLRRKIGGCYGYPDGCGWSVGGERHPWADEGATDGVVVLPDPVKVRRLSPAEQCDRVLGLMDAAR